VSVIREGARMFPPVSCELPYAANPAHEACATRHLVFCPVFRAEKCNIEREKLPANECNGL
jgi:hypothetical protein